MKTSDQISVFAAVISAIALISSVKSCQVSEQALQMTRLEYQGSRSLVIHGEIQKDNTSIKLTPQDQTFLLQQVHFLFPSSLGGSKRPVLAPDFVLYLPSEIARLKEQIAKRFPHKKDVVTVGLEARIPFLIETFATVKGANIRDRSIYTLNFQFSIPPVPGKEPDIKLLGMSFTSRLTPEQNSEKELEKVWELASKG